MARIVGGVRVGLSEPPGRSAARPPRRALLEERGHPLALVLGAEQLGEPDALEADPIVERQRRGGVDRRLRGGDREAGAAAICFASSRARATVSTAGTTSATRP